MGGVLGLFVNGDYEVSEMYLWIIHTVSVDTFCVLFHSLPKMIK